MGSVETVDVRGTGGEPIVLPIGPGPVTGHRWTLHLPPGVRQLPNAPGPPPSGPSPPPPSGPPPSGSRPLGAPSGDRLRVVAEPGEYLVTARLARPWEDRAVRVVELRLHVS